MHTFEIKRFSFTHHGREKPALDNINLIIREGEFITLCGKSGSGKSTLLRNLRAPSAPPGIGRGRITFFGRPIEMVPPLEQMRRIGYVAQDPESGLTSDSVWTELSSGLVALGMDERSVRLRVAEMVGFFGIQPWFRTEVSALSGGQKQMLTLASAMSLQPDVLLLDEPTAHLDPVAAGDFLDAVRRINRETGTTVVISEQRLEEVFQMSDRAVVMDRGAIIVDAPPKRVGVTLAQTGHDMALAMPAPMQVFLELEQDAAVKWRRAESGSLRSMGFPITVRDGREWLTDLFEGAPPVKRSIDRFRAPETDNAGGAVIEIKNLRFRYGKSGHDVIAGLDLTVPKAKFFCIVGGNGVGKSTAVKLIGGLLGPYRGSIRVNGKDIKKATAKERDALTAGLLPQNPKLLFTEESTEKNLLAVAGARVKPDGSVPEPHESEGKVAGVTALLVLDDLLDRAPSELSAGERQRVALGLTLLREPGVLLLDEPTKGLDNHFKERLAVIIRALLSQGKTVLMVSHDIEFCAKHADICALFFDGAVVASGEPGAFFSGNGFYTTAANRMSRHIFANAVTTKELIGLCRENIVGGK
jgi:energy-coupling factor transport system ATP-binding protein